MFVTWVNTLRGLSPSFKWEKYISIVQPMMREVENTPQNDTWQKKISNCTGDISEIFNRMPVKSHNSLLINISNILNTSIHFEYWERPNAHFVGPTVLNLNISIAWSINSVTNGSPSFTDLNSNFWWAICGKMAHSTYTKENETRGKKLRDVWHFSSNVTQHYWYEYKYKRNSNAS